MNIRTSNLVPLGEFMLKGGGSTDPAKRPNNPFVLYSIPAFDIGRPEIIFGRDIGSPKKKVAGGDVLLSRIVPHIRRSWIVGDHADSEILASGEWIVFRSDAIHGPYLRHFLVSDVFHPQFMKTVAGVGGSLLRAKSDYVAEITIPLPPLDEQRRIAAILDKADALRRKRKRSLDLISETASALAHQYLVGEKTELGNVIVEGPTNGLYKPSKDYGDGVPILRIDSFYNGRIIDIRSLKRLRASPAEIARFQLRVGDIVINRVNSLEYLGKSALVRKLLEPTVFESNMMRLSLDSSLLLPEVCIALLQTSDVKRQVLSKAKNAVNQSSINQGDVRSLRVPLPKMDQQRRFLRGIERLETIAARMIEGESQSVSLFSSLQHRAFSGQL